MIEEDATAPQTPIEYLKPLPPQQADLFQEVTDEEIDEALAEGLAERRAAECMTSQAVIRSSVLFR